MRAIAFPARTFFCVVFIVSLLRVPTWGAEIGSPHPFNASPYPSAERIPPSVPLAPAPAIISNGTVQLGVNPEGHLNVDGGTPSSGEGTTFVGLRYVPTNAESTAPGCLCEGWGAADKTSGVSGYANIAVGGVVGLTVESFETDATTAKSIVRVGDTLRVTHFYHPSDSPNLYQVDVTVENISGAPVELLYRRVMDWDIEPTAFAEFVTVQTGTAADLVFTSNDGFASANPLSGPSNLGFTGSFTDAGPSDHGALFDFNFGILNPGAKKEFRTFYGAAATEEEANTALSAVRAEAFSFGQPNTAEGPTLGKPNTFIFAFAGIGGTPIVPVADPQEVTTDENTPVVITLTGSDPENSPLTFHIVDQPAHGTVVMTAGKVKSKSRGRKRTRSRASAPEQKVNYTPDPGYSGPDSFTFKVNNGQMDSAPATVSITVTTAPRNPEISNLSFAERAYATSGIAALHNYSDPNGDFHHLDIISRAKNIPNGCGLLASDEATINFQELVDPLLEFIEYYVWQIGSLAMNEAAESGCTSVTLEMKQFRVVGADSRGATSNSLEGTFSITVPVGGTSAADVKGRSKGRTGGKVKLALPQTPYAVRLPAAQERTKSQR
ncbi:MAG: Ig-like domain-containing protein [Deltaproteobacteria bacterium]|nr:Ig-like domain-containing protein [Deltaproteobacteria bacterium]